MRLLIEARGPALEPAGIVEGYTECILLPRYNGVGTWSIKIPAGKVKAEIREAWDARGGIRVINADQPGQRPLLSGPITSDKVDWGATDRYGGTATLTGLSDERVLGTRIIWPDPQAGWDSQTAAAHHSFGPAPAETVIREYVRWHLGANALPARRWPGFSIDASLGRGALVSGNERFTPLLELCQSLALAGGTGWYVEQTADRQLVLRQFVPERRPDVLLSSASGSLRSGSSSVDAPELTRALVAGQGEMEDRMMVERVNAAAEAEWGRIEKLVDARQDESTDLLAQAGDQALLEGGPKAALSVSVQDTQDVQYGRDYQVGDIVPYVVRGVVLEDIVREVKITAAAGRTIVQPTIGPESTTSTPDQYRRLTQLERAVRHLRAT